MRIIQRVGVLACAAALSACAAAHPEPVVVTATSDSSREAEGVAQLERLLSAYNLERWVFTRNVVIQSRAIPHSHPELTLSTRYLNDDDTQLTVFLHEQAHWYFTRRDAATQAAIAEISVLYPDPPAREAGGASDPRSTWLHLMVCSMELDALTDVLGSEHARSVLDARTVYPWVYDQVLADGAPIRAVMAEHGLDSY